MEPMALGSPVGSPSASTSISPYLPQYLLGETEIVGQSLNQSLTQSHPGAGPSRQPFTSPQTPSRSGKHVSFATPPVASLSTPLSSADARLNRGAPGAVLLTQNEKGSGPPTTGLFDTLRPTCQSSTLLSPRNALETSVFETNLNASLLASSPPYNPPCSWSTSEPLTSNWVTVFGFPTSATSSILAQFARYGNIVDKHLPVQGNWMHLQYQTRIEVRRALGNNGKIFGGNTMIGVMPCTDPAITHETVKENQEVLYDPNLSFRQLAEEPRSPVIGQPVAGTSGNTSFASPLGTPRSVRPLQKAFSSTYLRNDFASPQHTPQRNMSFVARAMDYVFNW